MASFADKTFAHKLYAAFRPSYPPELYHRILNYHQGPRKSALDLGTGHGVVARNLAASFDNVYGSDISEGMIETARSLSTAHSNLTFHVSGAESSPFVSDSSLDLVTAAECAHWFNYPKFWPEMARIVRPGGTIAIWGYTYHSLVEYPRASSLINKYSEEMNERYLGPYWPSPGHQILHDLLRAVVPVEDEWSDVERIEYQPEIDGKTPKQGMRFMAGKMKLGTVFGMMRTWSAYHEWTRRWPERKQRAEGVEEGPGDIIDELLDEMRIIEPSLVEKAGGGKLLDLEVDTEAASTLILARRKQ